MREQLRKVRLQHGLTLAELGKHLGKSKQYMSELERGNIRLSYDMAVRIARIFGTTPDALFLPSESNDIGSGCGESERADRPAACQ